MSKVGLFSVGLDTYWGQFGSLLNNLKGYHNQIKNKLESFGAEIVDAEMVGNIDKAKNAANLLSNSGVDLIFLFVSTYALSSTILPISTGDVGNRYLFQALARNGLNEVMYKMHNHNEVPGYGFQLQFGATTLTELWDPRDGVSWNHFMMGQIEEWFYRSLGGIDVKENSYTCLKYFKIAPQIVGDLKFVNASYNTLYGAIKVDWKVDNGDFEMDVEVPVNCEAKVYLPQETNYTTVKSGKYSFEKKLN